MASSVKTSKILTLGNGFLVERAQNVGATGLQIPTEKIKETGNELNVSTERDIPQLSYDIESLDATIDTEAMICGIDPDDMNDGDFLTLAQAKPLDVVSPYKGAGTSKVSVGGVIYPYLILQGGSWRYGVGTQGASQTFNFAGDSQYQGKKTPYREVFVGDGVETDFNFAHTAVKTVEEGTDLFALSACVHHPDGTYDRLFEGDDWTSDSAGISFVEPIANLDEVAVTYFSATTATFSQLIHSTPSVKPGKVKGRHLNLYVAVAQQRTFNAAITNTSTTLTSAGADFVALLDDGARLSSESPGLPAGVTITVVDDDEATLSAPATATNASILVTLSPRLLRWNNVQQVEVNWRVQLDRDEELGNAHILGADYDQPDLSGTITVKPGSVDSLMDKIAQITGADPDEISNVLNGTAVELQVRAKNPKTGAVLKTLRTPDAQILPPGQGGRAGAKMENQFTWSSDSGLLEIYKGAPA